MATITPKVVEIKSYTVKLNQTELDIIAELIGRSQVGALAKIGADNLYNEFNKNSTGSVHVVPNQYSNFSYERW